MVACIGGNEMAPRTALECAIIAIFMLIAAFINASIFGEMAFLATVISKKTTIYQEKVDTSNTAMKNIKLENKI